MFAASKSGSADAKDANFKNVTMLLHGNGTNGAQNNTFVDSSTNNFTITRNGNTTQGTFTPYGDNWSNYFNGSSDYLTCSSSATNIGTSNFTIEFWVNFSNLPASGSNYDIISATVTTGVEILYRGTGSYIEIGSYGVGPSLQYSWTPSKGAWNHVAFVRNGTTVTIYINGTSVTSGVVATSFVTGTTNIGSAGGTQSYFNGYLSNLRVTKSVVYTSNFTPSTTPLTAIANTSLLTCQSNRFIDNSTNAFTMTVGGSPSVQRFSPFSPTSAYSTSVIGGSGYFDGSGDYLSFATGTAALGSNDFSIEAWVYPTSSITSVTLTSGQSDLTTVAGSSWTFNLGSSSAAALYVGVSGDYGITSASPVINAWNHVVFCRTSGTISTYLNGNRVATRTDLGSSSVNTGSTINPPSVGAGPSGGVAFPGFIAGLRRIIGSGGFSATGSTITVPTAPPTAVTNTNLLLNFTNAGILDNAEMNDLETMDGVQISTSVKKFGTGSISFDGNNDALYGANGQTIAFPADFTIESWVYLNTLTSSYQNFMLALTTGAAYIDFNSTYIDIGRRNIGADLTVTYTLPSTQWFHLAFCRSGSTMRIFVNGTQVGSGSVTTNYAASTFYISYPNSTSLNGYIDDLRITKGYARYTSNFTPPTAAFPNN